jgi:RimJ/RimL family protein N-acetyltransferase
VYCDQALIGYCTLEHIDTTNRSGEIGLVIGNPAYWHQGLGTLIVSNIASMRCFEKAGFQHEGRFREARYVNGGWIDLHAYAVLAQEWQH